MNNSNFRIKLLNKKKLEEKNQEPVQETVQENKIVNENNMSLEDKLKILPQHLVPQLMELLNKEKN
jgi:hypothetical protein